MKESCVVDCSFVAAFFLQESTGDRFENILREGALIQVPVLFHVEILNVFLMAMRQGRICREDARAMRMDLAALQIETVPGVSGRTEEAIFELADRHEISCYDAAYLEAALRTGGVLKTLDKDLLKLGNVYPWISDI